MDTLQSFYFYPFHLTDHLTRQLDLHARVRHDHQLYENWRIYFIERRAKIGTFLYGKDVFCSSLYWFQQECDFCKQFPVAPFNLAAHMRALHGRRQEATLQPQSRKYSVDFFSF